MPVLDYSSGSEIIHHSSNGITVYETINVEAINKAIFPTHVVAVPQTLNICTDRWEGYLLPRKELRPGDIVFMPGKTEVQSVSELPFNERIISLDDNLFSKAASDHIDYSKIDFRFAHLQEMAVGHIAQAMSHIAIAAEFSDWPMLVEANAYALVVALICALSPRASTAFREKPYGLSDFRMKRLVDYIDANLHRTITLAEMADLCTVSPFHFTRLFKKRTGKNVMKFISDRRVELAKKMIQKTGATLAQVAHDCGFSSQSHFTGVFKVSTGTTPAAYRKGVR